MSPSATISNWYRDRLGRSEKLCFFSALVTGIFAHLYAMTNFLFNYDSIAAVPYGLGNTLPSGRWFLYLIESVQEKIWLPYSIPTFNVLLSIFFIAVSACTVIRIFEIKEPLHCVLVGGIMVSVPTVTGMIVFVFTAPHYAFAIFLSALSAYYADREKRGVIPAILTLTLSLGIYQAYLPFTAALMVMLLARYILVGRLDVKAAIKKGLYFVAILICGMALYYLIQKLLMNSTGTVMNSYQGLDSMGVITLGELSRAVLKIYKTFILLPVRSYHSFNMTPVIRINLAILAAASFVMLLDSVCRRKCSVLSFAAVLFLMFIFPLAADGIEIMCSRSDIYVLMIYSMTACFIFPVVLLEAVGETEGSPAKTRRSGVLRSILSWAVVITVSFSVLNYCWTSNGNYYYLQLADKQTENYLNSVVTVMRSTEGYDENAPVAFIGDVDDPRFDSWRISTHFTYEGLFNSNDPRQNINAYSRIDMLRILLGYSYQLATPEQTEAIVRSEEFKDMSCFPNSGSVRMLDGVLTVKFSGK